MTKKATAAALASAQHDLAAQDAPAAPAPSTGATLLSLATLAAQVAGALTGTAPIVTNIAQLATTLLKLGHTFNTQVPLDANSQPLTLEAAQAHLDASVAASVAQDATITNRAQQALDENAAELAKEGT